jgi:hypothetical protein
MPKKTPKMIQNKSASTLQKEKQSAAMQKDNFSKAVKDPKVSGKAISKPYTKPVAVPKKK